MATFGERMKSTRKSKGFTLEYLSEKLETTKATLSRYENNKRTPDIYTAERIANLLEVDIDYLLGRTDDPDGEDKIHTIAAHHDGDEFTERELEEIEWFKRLVLDRRKKKD